MVADAGPWSSWTDLATLWWTRHGGLPAESLALQRRHALVRHARAHSPFYRRLYAALPRGDVPLASLPAVDKRTLMSHFNEWSSDPRVRLRDARRFLADPGRIGEPFLGRFFLWTSSGTSGRPGIFVQDAQAMAVYGALVAAQLEDVPWGPGQAARAMRGGGRAALVVATGDHFASVAWWQRMRRAVPRMDTRCFSILMPLPGLVAGLNEYRPAFLSGYPSILALLARERTAGRLAIEPALIWSGGEHLSRTARSQLEHAFGCPVVNEYGASECLSIAHECRAGWQHLHAEWVLLEAVDRDGAATPPGRLSEDTLLTNLANFAQPIIRYRLGDRILMRGRPCRCASPLPAFRVEGRVEATLAFASAHGAPVRLAPLALATVVESAVPRHPIQIAQVAPTRLALRFEAGPAQRLKAVRQTAARALRAYLAAQSLPHVEVVHDPSPPRREPRSGKLQAVVVEG